MAGPLDAIREHHKGIAAELKSLEAGLEGLSPERVGEEELRHILHFLLEDLLPHAAGEERALYPPAEELIRKYGRAVAPYELEHRTLEGLLDEFKGAAEKLLEGKLSAEERASATQSLKASGRQIAFLVSSHLRKEEEFIVPLLESYLPPEEQAEIVRQMHQHP
jgi:hemerythrin-like domain-containing protein